MSRIIEGSLEILRPIGAVMLKEEEEWEDEGASTLTAAAAAAAGDDDPHEEAHLHDDEESDDFDEDDSCMETDEASGSNDAKWRSKLELLRQYKREKCHCRVPKTYEIDGVKLGKWAATQMLEYRKHCKGKPSGITTGAHRPAQGYWLGLQ